MTYILVLSLHSVVLLLIVIYYFFAIIGMEYLQEEVKQGCWLVINSSYRFSVEETTSKAPLLECNRNVN